jgi:hypothetical protein
MLPLYCVPLFDHRNAWFVSLAIQPSAGYGLLVHEVS